jgi:NAD(P)H-hydrate epimerase
MARNSKALSALSAKAIDIIAQEELGISTLILMENAGRAVAEEALGVLKGKGPCVILCGKGNNGGDGFVAARHLLTKGVKPHIFLAGSIREVSAAARTNLDILLRLKAKIRQVAAGNLSLARKIIFHSGLIIDALLGVGLTAEVRGIYRGLIEAVNLSRAYVLSVDIPSGLDATSGKVLGCCVRADKTVTFMARKLGMSRGEGRRLCGRVVVRDLGLPYYCGDGSPLFL